jgi:hypothetical protein
MHASRGSNTGTSHTCSMQVFISSVHHDLRLWQLPVLGLHHRLDRLPGQRR